MGIYKLTAFEPTGEKLLDEGFEAADDRKPKKKEQRSYPRKGCSTEHIAVRPQQENWCCFIGK